MVPLAVLERLNDDHGLTSNERILFEQFACCAVSRYARFSTAR